MCFNREDGVWGLAITTEEHLRCMDNVCLGKAKLGDGFRVVYGSQTQCGLVGNKFIAEPMTRSHVSSYVGGDFIGMTGHFLL